MKIVLDTNVLLVSVSSKSPYHWVYKALIDGQYNLYVTDEILNEYEEKIEQHWNSEAAKSVIRTLLELPNVHFKTIYYKLNLIVKDADDNKFVDCSFAAQANAIVTEDKDFNNLKEVEFPKFEVWTIKQFKIRYKGN